MSTTSNIIRPLGLHERLYAARQVLGIYRSVIITAALSSQSTPWLETKKLRPIFRKVISETISQHHPLRCYIHDLETSAPVFKALDRIDLDDVLHFYELNETTDIVERLQELHDEAWFSDAKPLWKLVVLRERPSAGDEPATSTINLAFVYHHVLGDGLSGIAVLQSVSRILGSKLQSRPDQEIDGPCGPILTLDPVKLLEPVEKLIKLPLSWSFLLSQLMKEYAPRWLPGIPRQPWAGLPMQNLEQCPFRSRIKTVTIQASEVASLLSICRSQGVTITSLLTASIVSILAVTIPEAKSFVGVTPYTLRHLTGTSREVMTNQISVIETEYSPSTLDAIRATSSSPKEYGRTLWDTARDFHAQMRDELARCPQDTMLGLIPYISDPVKFYRKKFDKPREATFEVSNLGVVPKTSLLPGVLDLESMTFTQGAQPVATAFSVNCVGVQEGALRMAVTWQDSVVEERVLDAVIGGLGRLGEIVS
ncbi:MAG: hypothetical protein Q9220_004872 [cf. Caloplaca sp. 1 TL-2023]